MNMAGMDIGGMDMSGMDMPNRGGPSSKNGHAPNHDGITLCPFAAAATSMAIIGLIAALVVLVHTVIPRVYFPPERLIPRGTLVPTHLPRGPPAAL